MEFSQIYEGIAAKKTPLAVIGLGYVGLPLALELSRHFSVIGFDINEKRIETLRKGEDYTSECDISGSDYSIEYTSDAARISECHVVIIAVPTPITASKMPDLNPLESAIQLVGRNIRKPTVVVVESTVYPGATEAVCHKVMETGMGLKRGKDFKIGYSPERINPGDKEHTLDKITKIVSGEDEETLSLLSDIYGKITTVYKTPNIATAEAAKVIENVQRDLNIALVNELAMIFHRMNIDTNEVINAAATKWNFQAFRPGLVGGHCIGVDPYYLTHRAQELGYNPQVILSGRRVNDGMGEYIAEKTVKMLIESGRNVKSAKVAVFGITFKENIRDIRNSKVIDIISALREYKIEVSVTDPFALKEEVKHEYGIDLVEQDRIRNMDCLILAVPHGQYLNKEEAFFMRFVGGETSPVFMDIKSAYNSNSLPGFNYWRL